MGYGLVVPIAHSSMEETVWRGDRDLNAGPPAPQAGALSAELPPRKLCMVRPPRFERGAFGSGGRRSIQLSYGRTLSRRGRRAFASAFAVSLPSSLPLRLPLACLQPVVHWRRGRDSNPRRPFEP